MNTEINTLLSKSIKNLYDIDVSEIHLEIPPKKEMGDYAFGVFILAKILKKSPIQIGEELVSYITSDQELKGSFSKIVLHGPYVNFFLSGENIAGSYSIFMKEGKYYGDISVNNNKNIIIDYIGANVGKPLHIGHMCTPNHGQVCINLFHKLGFNVISDSHIGDWGIIFGKLIVAYEKYGNEKDLQQNAVEHLFELYVKISTEASSNPSLEDDFRSAFKKLSQGDNAFIQLWEKFTKHSIGAMNIQLGKLGIKPQFNIGESFYEGLGLPKIEDYPDLEYSMHDVVNELLDTGIATKNEDNSVGVIFSEDTKIPSCVLQKRDGTHGYLASDLACVKYRMKNWNPQKIIYFVDVRQQLHLRQVFEISRAAGWLDDNTELTHAYNGFIALKDGAMSTRTGKIIKLEALLDEAEKRAKEIILEKRDDISGVELKKLSKIIGFGAIKYGYLKKTRTADVIFDWDEFMTFEGNSGPYIQYAYVRAKKILDKYDGIISFENLDFSSEEEKKLAQNIMNFPNIIQDISKNYSAHILCSYMYDMTKNFSSLYNNVSILGAENKEVLDSRVALVYGFTQIIRECFEILAIELPDEM